MAKQLTASTHPRELIEFQEALNEFRERDQIDLILLKLIQPLVIISPDDIEEMKREAAVFLKKISEEKDDE